MEDVHGGRADEAGHKEVGRPLIELGGLTHLLDLAVVQKDDLAGHGHGLGLVMGDIDGGGLQRLMEPDQFHPHVFAELGIQVGQGFIQEEDPGLSHHGPAQGHPLPLAT